MDKLFNLFYRVNIYYSLIGLLVILAALGMVQFGVASVLVQVLSPLFATTISGAFFDYLEQKKWFITPGPIISGLILGLVAQFGEEPMMLAAMGVAAMAIKFFIKWRGRNVFNPAASGLLVGMVLLSSYPAWWGGELVPWLFALWIPGLLLKFKRWAPMAAFLVPVVLLSGVTIFTSGSLLFFLSVMLIEPMTSPFKTRAGLVYGVVVAAGYLVWTNFPIDPLIPSLLFGNLTARILERYLWWQGMDSRNVIIVVVVLAVMASVWWYISSQRPQNTLTPVPTPTVELAPTQSPEATETASQPAQAVITILSSGFSPKDMKIKAGETVTWMNNDSENHQVNSVVHPTHQVYPPLNTVGLLKANEQKSLSFPDKGTYRYHDHLNPSSTGSVVVE